MRRTTRHASGSRGRARAPWTTGWRTTRSLALASAVALLAAGCDDLSSPAGPAGMEPPEPGLSVQEVSQQETPSQEAVAEAVPGFAGYFLADGDPTAYLTDPDRRPEVEEALDGWLSSRGLTASDLEVRQASYDWGQLSDWYEEAWPAALVVDGAVLSDIDEGSNRLRFGGSSATAVAQMATAVAATGVPDDAFVVEEVSPIEPVRTLRDRVRPVPGGYQINFLNTADAVTVSLICTLGFNVVPEAPEHEPNASFVTNSHCSEVEADGATAQTDYYQPLQDPDGDDMVNPENLIGTEVHDPAVTVSADCPDALPCRWSDAARAEYTPDVPFELGKLARTAEFDPLLGTLEVDPKKPTFEITDEQRFAVLGETAHKVGRTTGWTGGEVTATCVNVVAIGGSFVRRCQAQVSAGVDSGDSGSPVFLSHNRRGNVNSGKVVLNGILWGGSVEGDPHFTYSPMFNIERELGPLQTH